MIGNKATRRVNGGKSERIFNVFTYCPCDQQGTGDKEKIDKASVENG